MITIDFSKRNNLGLCEFLYESIKEQIQTGILKADEKLPSKRALASHLGISIITVQNAYGQLISEGYIYSIEKKGFFVTDISIGNQVFKNITVQSCEDENFVQKEKITKSEEAKQEEKKWFVNFKSNTTSYEKFPFSQWSHVMRQVLNSGDEKLLQRMSANGVLELRFAICQYLLEFRNMSVAPNQIVVGSGTEALYTMLVQLLGRNSVYAVENPGYKKVATVFEINGANYVPINIEKNGINIGTLEASCANVIHISPSHHFPTGLVMPVRCRGELLDWAAKDENRFIIEDDYDSEFRFNGKPLQTLQSSDTNDCVIYINTFSKTLAPSFRISYMVLPKRLVNDFQEKLGFSSCAVSSFEQYTLAEFLQKGFYAKHIIRMKNYYRNLRNNLIHCLQASKLSEIFEIQEEDSGLHFLLKINSVYSGEELKNRLQAQGINPSLLSDFFYNQADGDEQKNILVINYSGIKKEQISELVLRMEKAILEN